MIPVPMIWLCLGLIVSINFVGCGHENRSGTGQLLDERSPRISLPAREAVSIVDQERTVRRAAISLPSSKSVASPTDGNWRSEEFSDAVSAQLKTLNKILDSEQPPTDRELGLLVSQDINCSPLRPGRLSTVFEDRSFTVRRPDADSATTTSAATPRGISGFMTALADLRSPRIGSPVRYGEFKIFRVDLSDESPTTSVIVHLVGRAVDRIVQQSAVWNCRWERRSPEAAPLLLSVDVTEYEEVVGRGTGDVPFSDCTESVLGQNAVYQQQLVHGLDHWLDRFELFNGIVATSYHGLAIGDVNGDRLDDLYICQPGGLLVGLPNLLLVQQPDGTLLDRSESSGLDWLVETHSALFVDLDNDGDQDLAAATMAGIIIAVNDGQGRFQPKTIKLIPEAQAISLSAADYDNDGDLDLYTSCYARRAAPELRARPLPYHDANNGGRNILFRNDQDFQFTNVTKHVGLDENNHRFSLACAWEDYDNDGDQDLFVANDFGRDNLYRNEGGRFSDVAPRAGVDDVSAGMSAAWGDYNRDGWMDLYVGNMWSSAGNRVAHQKEFLRGAADSATLSSFRRHARGNSLFCNLGRTAGTTFEDVSLREGVTMGRWAWSSRFVDINNDGWEDLLVANGYITQENPDDL